MVTTRPPKTIVKLTALGPVANTDTKLLIYGLFQKGRVLAQDGIGLVVVDVKLFAEAGTPVYHAVVGEIDTKNPGHFAALEQYRSAGRLALLPSEA